MEQTDKDWVNERIINVSSEIAGNIIKEVMVNHVNSCPHGKKLSYIIFLAIGIGVGSGVASGSLILGMIGLFS